VNRLGRTLAETFDLQALFQRLAEAILELLEDTSTVHVFMHDEENRVAKAVYAIHDGNVLSTANSPNIPLGRPGEGMLSQVIQTGESMIVNQLKHFYENPRLESDSLAAAAFGTESMLLVPIISSARVIGVLQVQSHLPSRYTPSDSRLLGLVANTAAAAVQNARLFDQLQERVDQFSTLHSIDIAIGSTTDLRVSLQVVLEAVVRVLKVDAAGVLLYNPPTLSLEYAGGVGFHSWEVTRAVVRLGEPLAGRAALTRQAIEVPNLAEADLPAPLRKIVESERFVYYHNIPLIAKGEVKGVLELYHHATLQPDQEWNNLLNLLAGQAAIAMDNGLLFNSLERAKTDLELAYDATIEGWSQALELRDQETQGHTRRLLDTTLTLSRRLGVPDSEYPHIRRGVLLHDIGKMGVPDSILLKPGPLDEKEWEVMRQHPQLAYRLLSSIGYLHASLDIPYSHHEKWDGSGYPRGLKGDQIPLAVRAFSVVDVYDALSYDRPYRPAWPKEKVIAYIQEQAGTYFDPRVVDAFMEIVQGS
jgi:HD-GYP domain-containing protein (c-di-GMP phosphodiesterase class II)/putative methionine-R-sulfoxide reductase with GAF domain